MATTERSFEVLSTSAINDLFFELSNLFLELNLDKSFIIVLSLVVTLALNFRFEKLNINTNIPIIFDDTMADSYLECANLVGKKLNKKCETFQCKRNKYAVCWFEGKKFSLII